MRIYDSLTISKQLLALVWGIHVYNLKRLAKNVRADSLQRNSLYLILNAGIGSVLGFVFWVIVARYYTPYEVGLASAILSASMMIATLSNPGFGIGIIRYLPSAKENSIKLINSFMTVASGISIVLSVIFLASIDHHSKNLAYIKSSHLYSLIFILFTLCILLVQMQDSIFIAKRKSEYILLKNLILNIRILFPVFFLSIGAFGIFASYGIAFVLALIISTLFLIPRIIEGYFPNIYIDKFLIKKTFNYSIGNYIASFFEMAPGLLLPIIIANILNPELTAYFYIAWTVAGILYMIPRSITTSLFAEGSHMDSKFHDELIKSIKLILILVIPSMCAIFLFGSKLLYLFGKNYSENAIVLLQILTISTLPLAINSVYFAKWRVEKKISNIITVNAFIATITLAGGIYFAPDFGIIGFGIAWFFAQIIMSLANARKYLMNIFKNFL